MNLHISLTYPYTKYIDTMSIAKNNKNNNSDKHDSNKHDSDTDSDIGEEDKRGGQTRRTNKENKQREQTRRTNEEEGRRKKGEL